MTDDTKLKENARLKLRIQLLEAIQEKATKVHALNTELTAKAEEHRKAQALAETRYCKLRDAVQGHVEALLNAASNMECDKKKVDKFGQRLLNRVFCDHCTREMLGTQLKAVLK